MVSKYSMLIQWSDDHPPRKGLLEFRRVMIDKRNSRASIHAVEDEALLRSLVARFAKKEAL